MKTIKNIPSTPFIFLLSMAFALTLLSGSSYAQSQSGMNSSAAGSYKQADNELNRVYQNILKEYSAKAQFIKNIKAAQRLWLKLRDADLAARFPEKGQYGSAESMCRASYLESLTRDRIKVLKVWVDGIPEGDVCNGSVKTR
ncbi:lysozyme inhibitor LprI family protein [Pedobacter antarcticus]|uniref:lysozyme inhibitor LprI family protein n=1 Tax=Pedobacter antarcticus TaxID=34086 RepID=UPI002930AB91|nr:lysozyme inhibitor LprI family protein [Pedobacter antarcticus]